MKLIYKLAIIVVIWTFGIWGCLTARSDAAGLLYARISPILLAMVASFPICIWILSSKGSNGNPYTKIRKLSLYIPLLVCISPLLIYLFAAAYVLLFP